MSLYRYWNACMFLNDISLSLLLLLLLNSTSTLQSTRGYVYLYAHCLNPETISLACRLLQRRVHVEFLTVSPSSLHRIRAHLYTRPYTSTSSRTQSVTWKYLRTRPPQPIRRLIRYQLSKPQHQPIHKWQQQVDRCAAQQAPERGRLVQNQG